MRVKMNSSETPIVKAKKTAKPIEAMIDETVDDMIVEGIVAEVVFDEVEAETVVEKPIIKRQSKPKLLPVKLRRNCRPAGKFKIFDHPLGESGIPDEDQPKAQRDPNAAEIMKVFKGTEIFVNKEYALWAIEKGICERNDEFG
jgi:hypothetical protein